MVEGNGGRKRLRVRVNLYARHNVLLGIRSKNRVIVLQSSQRTAAGEALRGTNWVAYADVSSQSAHSD
jgi:hypothetical protein